MTEHDFRKLALSLPGASEGKHFHVEDFRVGGKIFATLAFKGKGQGVLLLTPAQQEGLLADAPHAFTTVPNKWGDRGATLVLLSAVNADLLEGALKLAWANRAPQGKASGTSGKKRAARKRAS